MKFLLTYDFSREALKTFYPQYNSNSKTYNNSYNEIKNFLTSKGFVWKQKSVYIGDFPTAQYCINVIKQIARKFQWLKPSVEDIRIFEIAQETDLKPLI